MKRTIAILLLTAGIMGAGSLHAQKKITRQEINKILVTEMDSVAYCMGIDMGEQLRNMDKNLNPEMIAKGFIESFRELTPMEREEAVTFLREYYMERLPNKYRQESEAWLAQVEKSNSNIQKTESGLLYEIVNPGDASERTVFDDDTVIVSYVGKKQDGSTIDENEHTTFHLNRVIAGFSEGLQLIGKGGTIKLWIPSDLAYGERGNQQIKPNEALYYEVTLLDVNPDEE